MKSSILTLTWPKDLDMLDVKRFETEARTRRYQALGRACRDKNIRALMVAHHGDDQAETVLMRLANNRLRTGLKGMQSVEWIPECEGIYGVYHSGKREKQDTFTNIPFPVEQGGIQILRPLLALEKSRLIATCEEQGVQWAEDKSNQIQTLTSRNAIRHIYRNHTLPEALSIKSLVDVSLHMQKRIAAHRSYTSWLYDQCLLKLDIRTGSLIVRFPSFASLLERPIETESDRNEARNNAYCLLEKVADLVTPKFKPALGQLAARVDSIYPEFLTPEEKSELAAAGESHFDDKFTVYHVWWRQWDKASPFEDHDLPCEDFGSSAPHSKEWLLTRQALENGEAQKLQIAVPPSQVTDVNSESPHSEEDYQLFDGRFWIKLQNYTRDTLLLRNFQKADMKHLPVTQGNKEAPQNRTGPIPERFITAAFALIKPSDLRFTLPAVFRKDSTTGKEILIGFPTLNVRMNGLGPPEDVCHWRVRYKKVDFGERSISDMIISGSNNEEVVDQEKQQRVANKGVIRLKVKRKQAVESDASDSFTGYKRVSEKSGNATTKRGWKYKVLDIQRSVGGEEAERSEFSKDKSETKVREKEGKKISTASGSKVSKHDAVSQPSETTDA
jgi:tRNA(Ile)-lysidine synthase